MKISKSEFRKAKNKSHKRGFTLGILATIGFFVLAVIQNALEKEAEAENTPLKLTLPQYSVLRCIEEYGFIPFTALCSFFPLICKEDLQKDLTFLEEKGLVRITRSKETQAYSATEQGKEILKQSYSA